MFPKYDNPTSHENTYGYEFYEAQHEPLPDIIQHAIETAKKSGLDQIVEFNGVLTLVDAKSDMMQVVTSIQSELSKNEQDYTPAEPFFCQPGNITDNINAAIEQSKKSGRPCKVNFNGTLFRVYPNSNPDDVLNLVQGK